MRIQLPSPPGSWRIPALSLSPFYHSVAEKSIKNVSNSKFLSYCLQRWFHRNIMAMKGGATVSKGNPSVHLRLDRATMAEIAAQAEALGVTVAEFIRQIIYAYLEEHS